jgi:hypothetical protein
MKDGCWSLTVRENLAAICEMTPRALAPVPFPVTKHTGTYMIENLIVLILKKIFIAAIFIFESPASVPRGMLYSFERLRKSYSAGSLLYI